MPSSLKQFLVVKNELAGRTSATPQLLCGKPSCLFKLISIGFVTGFVLLWGGSMAFLLPAESLHERDGAARGTRCSPVILIHWGWGDTCVATVRWARMGAGFEQQSQWGLVVRVGITEHLRIQRRIHVLNKMIISLESYNSRAVSAVRWLTDFSPGPGRISVLVRLQVLSTAQSGLLWGRLALSWPEPACWAARSARMGAEQPADTEL